MKLLHLWPSLVLIFSSYAGLSQDSTVVKSPLMFSVSTMANYGFIVAHSEKVQNTSNAHPAGITVALNWQRTDRQDFDLYRCLPRHSLQLAYYSLGKDFLGKGVNVSYAMEPHFMLNNSLSLYPKIAAGLGFLSNPHDSISNPSNRSYSLPVNVYISLGAGLRWQLSKQWAMNLNTEFQHISNGGLYKPNVGINWPTFGAGIEFSPRGMELKKHEGQRTDDNPVSSRRFDIQLFGVMKYGDFTGAGAFYPIAGLNLTHSWQVNRIHAWTVSAEIYQDNFIKEHDSTGGVVSSGTRVGVLAGHEFLLGRFIFSQQIGVYLTDAYHKDVAYHRWGLQYYFIPRWSVGFNLLVHRATADFADLRLTYSFWRK